jgi:hypothetical protein
MRTLEFGHDLLEAPGLDPAGRGFGVAVHGIAAPEDLSAVAADGLDQSGQQRFDPVGAQPMNEGQAPGFVGRVQDLRQASASSGVAWSPPP